MSSGLTGKVTMRTRNPGGFTIVEVLVALAITAVFLLGVVTAFVQIIRATNVHEKYIEAAVNASTAIELMAIDIKEARIDPSRPDQIFFGRFVEFSHGNGIDDDGDGIIDEETLNGKDDDGDFVDQHADIMGITERMDFVGIPDSGDLGVDEDVRFRKDRLILRLFPDPANPDSRNEVITFEIGPFEDENNVLLRKRIRKVGETEIVVEEAPLAFEVLSLALLYWDLNAAPPTWTIVWDASQEGGFNPPGIELPGAVLLSVTVYAGDKPFEEFLRTFNPGSEVDTITMHTIVNIEQILDDPRYPRRR